MGFRAWLGDQLRIIIKSNLRSGGTVEGVLRERARIKEEDQSGAEQRRKLARAALDDASRRAVRQAQAQRGRDIQYKEGSMRVEVRNGYSVDSDKYTTDIIIIGHGFAGVVPTSLPAWCRSVRPAA